MIADLEGDGAIKKTGSSSDNAALELAQAKNLLMSSMPSYVNTEMGKLLPKDILSKQGVRVIDNSAGQLCDLLKRHANTADEI